MIDKLGCGYNYDEPVFDNLLRIAALHAKPKMTIPGWLFQELIIYFMQRSHDPASGFSPDINDPYISIRGCRIYEHDSEEIKLWESI